MKLARWVFVLIFIGGCSLGSNDSEKIVETLRLEGEPYFNQLVSTQEYEALLNKIEKGDEGLIDGSRIMARWVDASTSVSLRFSLSRAIIHNPDSVMNLIPEVFSVADLCVIPYIEESIEVELRHVNEALSALEGSKGASESHTECIEAYKKIINNIKKSQTDAESRVE